MITRRQFLGGALAGVAAARVPRVFTAEPRAVTARRVAVIGAGLAGLTAALDLVEVGWDVVVLEARDRVGGRVFTAYEPFSDGLHAELGGESIDEGHHALLNLVHRFGLLTDRRPPQKPYDAVVYRNGARTRLPLMLARRNGGVLRDVLRYYDAESALGDGVDPTYPEHSRRAEQLDATSLEQFLRAQRLSPEAEFLMRVQLRGLYNAEPRDVSLLFIAQQAAQSATEAVTPVDDDIFSETRRIRGGNSRLPKAMAHALGSRVRLNQAVRRVEHRADGVRVTTADGSVIDAAWAVVAAPPRPLRAITFAPALPSALAAAVAGLDLGDAVKVVREYKRAFWTPEAYSGFTVSDLPFAIAWSETDSRAAALRGVMAQFVTGDAARHAASLSDAARVAEFTRQVDIVYPEARSLATRRTATHAWHNDPFTGGGYAVFKPGQMAPFFNAFRHGAGRLRFAGEHTCNLAGYMESAVRSGHRVAAEIGSPLAG
ncbi:MAG TPA: NAD(P)/FAD-dependent oxidoreductase [Acidimicrobiales bacterium]|nr:NAD(P)/FAD-dependent oxidoreductase [Acidimicrobiales bacterium]